MFGVASNCLVVVVGDNCINVVLGGASGLNY